MVREAFKYMKGNVFYPYCGTDVIWGECTNYGCDHIVFGDENKKALEEVNRHIKEKGMKGGCVRLNFDNLPFREGSFQTVIYKPGPGFTLGICRDTPKLKEAINPQIFVAVKTVGCMHCPDAPVTKEFIDDFSKKHGYNLKEAFVPEIEDNVALYGFPPTFVLIFENS